MQILNSEQIRKVDALTLEYEPVTSIELMERAASACYYWIRGHFDSGIKVKVFAGPGNNGGDGLAIARMLALAGMNVWVILIKDPSNLSADALVNYNLLINLQGISIFFIKETEVFPVIDYTDLVIDALFGSGLSRPIDGFTGKLVNYMNQSGAAIVSIDIPSGLHTEENTYKEPETIIHATYTLTFQAPKLSFFFAENEPFVGKWHHLDIRLSSKAINEQETSNFYTGSEDISKLLHIRKKFAHKGNFGHALLMAGSFGKMGAAVMSAKSCLRSGVGLLTVQVPSRGYDILQISVPEAMTIIDENPYSISIIPEFNGFNAIGIGPGIGTDEKTSWLVHDLLTTAKLPIVIDADAINLISLHPDLLDLIPPNSILTPHPGEFDRLTGPSQNGYHRNRKQIEFSRKYKIIIVLKGAYTSISTPDGKCLFNSTGNPGMATAGSGDVLTGITLSLLAQGYPPEQAALIAVFLHGLAGDLAKDSMGEEALIASDIINYLGKAFLKLKRND